MSTHLLFAAATDQARAVLERNHASVTILREQAPHVEMVVLPQQVIYHGRHPQECYVAYTLDRHTGQGICFWDSNPLSCQLYSWQSHPEEIASFLESNGRHWPESTAEYAPIAEQIQQLCERILQEPKINWSNAWEAQQDRLNEWEAAMLRAVVPLLPGDLQEKIGQALTHHQELEQL